MRPLGDAAFGQELAGGEREELPVARGDRGAEQADPQVRFSVNGCRAGNPGADDASKHDLAQRQQHDAAEGERGEGVLGASRNGPHLVVRPDGHHF